MRRLFDFIASIPGNNAVQLYPHKKAEVTSKYRMKVVLSLNAR